LNHHFELLHKTEFRGLITPASLHRIL
jgi:hypothetical protein